MHVNFFISIPKYAKKSTAIFRLQKFKDSIVTPAAYVATIIPAKDSVAFSVLTLSLYWRLKTADQMRQQFKVHEMRLIWKKLYSLNIAMFLKEKQHRE